MKLSIIIPAYNAENYIESCITSCYQQDLALSDYELIIINDGSTDNTEQKVCLLAKAYSNLHLKSQANQGHGAARNTGVSISKGDYLYFLDADDYIAENTLGTLITVIEDHQLDILGFSSKQVSNSNILRSTHSKKDLKLKPILNGIDFLASYNYKPEVWRYITKRAFYLESNMFFYDKKFVQDSFFTPTLICKAKRILYVDYDVHRYRLSKNSISRNTSNEHLMVHLNDMCFAVQKLFSLRQDLINEGITNTEVLNVLHQKQQHYAFIIIARFMRSNFKTSMLTSILSNFKMIGAYPLHEYQSTLNYKAPLNLTLSFIFNTKMLLYPSIHSYRMYKGLRKKFRLISLI